MAGYPVVRKNYLVSDGNEGVLEATSQWLDALGRSRKLIFVHVAKVCVGNVCICPSIPSSKSTDC